MYNIYMTCRNYNTAMVVCLGEMNRGTVDEVGTEGKKKARKVKLKKREKKRKKRKKKG